MTRFPPLKRMAILERRKGDERTFFSCHWRDVHGGMVSRLPHLAGYIQNHIVEDFAHVHETIPGDGFVEQLWWGARDMQRGYNSSVAQELVEDEVNYLGHGSNYVILASEPLRRAEAGEKLIIAARHAGNVAVADHLESIARSFGHCIRDDVIATIPKVNMLPAQPHPVDVLFHIYCPDPRAASQAGRELIAGLGELPVGAAAGVWRVRTATIIECEQV